MNSRINSVSPKNTSGVITIGTFDGVHIGHQKILKHVVDIAKKQRLKSIVLTLFPHPRMVLQKEDSIKLLNSINERIDLLKSIGIDEVVVKTFTKDFANLSAKDYVTEVLVNELNAKQIVIGYDHRFGKNRSANIDDLKQLGEVFDFKVNEIPAEDIDSVTVSSTKIRNALQKGNVALANTYLGYDYFITGKVVKGKSLGRTLGFPTANLRINADYKLIPKDGVYVIYSLINHQKYYGMMNIGTNPTIDDKGRSIEVHLFDFEDNIYDQELTIYMIKRLRDEKRFASIDLLKNQLITDELNAKQVIALYND